MLKQISILFITSILLTGCATILLPKRQRVQIEVDCDSSLIYLDNKVFISDTGMVKVRIRKSGIKQIKIEAPGYKNTYTVLKPLRRPLGFWLLQPLNFGSATFGFLFDFMQVRNFSYAKVQTLTTKESFCPKRDPALEKQIEPGECRIEIADRDLDFLFLNLDYSTDSLLLAERKFEAEKSATDKILKIRKKRKVESRKTLEEKSPFTHESIYFFEKENFIHNIDITLKDIIIQTNYLDTTNRLFADNNNTVILEPLIRKIRSYRIKGKGLRSFYNQVNLTVDWQVKTTYGILIKSFTLETNSGEFEDFAKGISDAIGNSYLQLLKNSEFKAIIKRNPDYSYHEPDLILKQPESPVTDKSEVPQASVIVQTKEGHGSGFAINNNGYIITNYHVVAHNSDSSIEVIDVYGNKYPAKLVRFNGIHDLALLKIDHKMSRAFSLHTDSSFKLFQTVFAIGAPKSVDLGQSISQGIISSVRRYDQVTLIQLNMSLNSGNSGGAVFDKDGIIQGVVVAKLIGKYVEGISFAIPAHRINEYLNVSYE